MKGGNIGTIVLDFETEQLQWVEEVKTLKEARDQTLILIMLTMEEVVVEAGVEKLELMGMTEVVVLMPLM